MVALNIKIKLDAIISSLPNIHLKDVPIGSDENDNKEIVSLYHKTKILK